MTSDSANLLRDNADLRCKLEKLTQMVPEFFNKKSRCTKTVALRREIDDLTRRLVDYVGQMDEYIDQRAHRYQCAFRNLSDQQLFAEFSESKKVTVANFSYDLKDLFTFDYEDESKSMNWDGAPIWDEENSIVYDEPVWDANIDEFRCTDDSVIWDEYPDEDPKAIDNMVDVQEKLDRGTYSFHEDYVKSFSESDGSIFTGGILEGSIVDDLNAARNMSIVQQSYWCENQTCETRIQCNHAGEIGMQVGDDNLSVLAHLNKHDSMFKGGVINDDSSALWYLADRKGSELHGYSQPSVLQAWTVAFISIQCDTFNVFDPGGHRYNLFGFGALHLSSSSVHTTSFCEVCI